MRKSGKPRKTMKFTRVEEMLKTLTQRIEDLEVNLKTSFVRTGLDALEAVKATAPGALATGMADLARIYERIMKPNLEAVVGELRTVRWLLDQPGMFRFMDKNTAHVPPPAPLTSPPGVPPPVAPPSEPAKPAGSL